MLSRPIVASMWRPWDSPPYDRYAPPYPDQSYVPLGASEAEVRALLDRPKATSWIDSDQGFVMHLKPGIIRSNSEHSACTEGFTTPEEKSVRTDRVSWVAYGAQFRLPEVHPSGLGDVIALNAQFQVNEAKTDVLYLVVSAIRYMDNSAILQVETRAGGIIAQIPMSGTFAEVHVLHDNVAGTIEIMHDGASVHKTSAIWPEVWFRVNVGRRANTQILRQGFVEASLCSDLRWLQDPIDTHWRSLTEEPIHLPDIATTHKLPAFSATAPAITVVSEQGYEFEFSTTHALPVFTSTAPLAIYTGPYQIVEESFETTHALPTFTSTAPDITLRRVIE